MAKGAKADKGKTTTLTDAKGDTSVVGAEADGFNSIKLYLSNGQEVMFMAAGGDNFAANQQNRDVNEPSARRSGD